MSAPTRGPVSEEGLTAAPCGTPGAEPAHLLLSWRTAFAKTSLPKSCLLFRVFDLGYAT